MSLVDWFYVTPSVNHDVLPSRRFATAALVILGLLVAAAGLFIVRTDARCEAACGTGADQAFRDSMGYLGLILGGSSIALSLWGRRRLASVLLFVGGICFIAAFVEGLSHLR
jgi:hypothetical protein